MQRHALWLCLLLLCGCANIPNTHPHTAIPPKHEQLRFSLGYSSSSNPYILHDYSPAVADSIIKNSPRDDFNQHTPLNIALGLGKGYAAGIQIASFAGARFYGTEDEEHYLSGLAAFKPALYVKCHLQKSLDLGRHFYVAMFPAIGFGAGTHSLTHDARIRFIYKSLEVPFTLSKAIEFSDIMQLTLSGTGRIAQDWIDGDLNVTLPWGMYNHETYENQPQLKALRSAYMGHLDFRFDKWVSISFQIGNERVRLKTGQSWEPIFYTGLNVHFQ